MNTVAETARIAHWASDEAIAERDPSPEADETLAAARAQLAEMEDSQRGQ